jgi:pentapeptide repeat protein
MILHHPRARPLPWTEIAARHSWWHIPFVATEYVFDWATFLLSNWAFLETLEYLGSLSILIAVVFYFAESDGRVKQRHYQAWQVINTAQGKGGSGGRIEALQELDDDKVSLTGVDVSAAFLQGIRLPHAALVRADFHNTDARGGDFHSADFSDANLTGANFRKSNLRKATLQGASLVDADLWGSDLRGANLANADLANADLRNSDLGGVEWKGIQNIKAANLFGAKNASAEFVTWALQHGAVQLESDSEWSKRAQVAGQ